MIRLHLYAWRAASLDAAYRLLGLARQAAAWLATTPRWTPTGLFAAAITARYAAAHRLLDQASDRLDDGDLADLTAVSTSPLVGSLNLDLATPEDTTR